MTIDIGPLSVHLYGVMISLGVIGALAVAYSEAKRYNLNPEHLFNMALLIIPLGVIGARLYHVIDQWTYYSAHPAQIIGGAGLGIYGAIIGGIVGLLIYARWKKLDALRWLDTLAPGLILAQSIGRWGNFFNQELYGYPTTLPWAVYIAPENRLPGYEGYTHFQPLFLYESLLNIVGFGVLIIVGRKWQARLLKGDIFILYLMYYSVVRFMLEGLKINVWTIAGFPTARWISLICFSVSLAVIIYRHRKRKLKDSQ